MTNIKYGCQQYNTQSATFIKEKCESVPYNFNVKLLLSSILFDDDNDGNTTMLLLLLWSLSLYYLYNVIYTQTINFTAYTVGTYVKSILYSRKVKYINNIYVCKHASDSQLGIASHVLIMVD